MPKHRDEGRTVFLKGMDFYMDSLSKCDYEKVLEGLKEEILALKRENEEASKLRLEHIKYF